MVKKPKISNCDRVDHAVSVAAVKIANEIGAKGLIVLTEGGNTALDVSYKYKLTNICTIS